MRKILVVAVAALLMPAAAQADTFSVCAPGSVHPSFHACASATVSFVGDATGGNIILQVRNLGLFNAGVESQAWGYAITGIGITAPEIANPSWVGVEGTEEVGDAAGGWDFATSFMGFQVQAGGQTSSGTNGGIWGCYGTPGAGPYFKTCEEGEFVTFTFRTTNTNWNGDNALVSFAMRGQSGYEGDSYRCSDDPTATNGNGGCEWGTGEGSGSTVPEPISLVLLGSGLLGLAGVRSRRR